MFGLFKKSTPLELLEKKRAKLMKESFDLSKTDRAKSDLKQAEAHQVELQIEELLKKK